MPRPTNLRALGGKGPTLRGSMSPLRDGSTNAGLGSGRGLATNRTRSNSEARIRSVSEAIAKKEQ